MVEVKNVLVVPAGTENGLEIFYSLSALPNLIIHGLGYEENFSSLTFHKNHLLSMQGMSADEIVVCINKIIDEVGIDYLFITTDELIYQLSPLRSKIKTKLVMPNEVFCEVARFKSKTYEFLSGVIPLPEVFKDASRVNNFPVFVKPDRGQGSRGAAIIHSQQELTRLDAGFIITEYLPGKEYTIDCFSDKGDVIYCQGRSRLRTKDGVSVHTKVEENPIFLEYALSISKKLMAHGAWFFQVKEDRFGIPRLMEVAPRIAGAMALSRVVGANLPAMALFQSEGSAVSLIHQKMPIEVHRALTNKYIHNLSFSNVYIDFDDTILLSNNKINTQMIRLIYQFINQNKRVILISKHAGDLKEKLKIHRLSQLFDEVLHLDALDCKHNYMKTSSIFIDDSFSERYDVYTKSHGEIVTFDCSAIEMLIQDF